MKSHFQISILAYMTLVCGNLQGAAPAAEEIEKFSRNRPELDEITWKDPARGAPLAVRIIQSSGQAVVVEKTLATGLTIRNIPMADLAGVSFKLTPPEVSLHREPKITSIPWLRVLWERRQATLRLTGSNVGETGLILAKSLRLSGEKESLQEALKILSQIRSQDLVKPRIERAQAEQLTLQFIIAQKSGDMLETDRLAWEITEGTENQDGMILATAFLGDRHFANLKATEEEHPRWMDDDEVLPLRQRLYQLSLDFFLYPSLFLGTRETEASLGLKRASEVHQFTGSNALLKATLEDLAALYPETEAAKETAPLLTRLRDREAAGKLAETLTSPEEEEATEEGSVENARTEPPPSPKRYNIFVD